MTSLILSIMVFCQVLEIDSIIDPGTWTNPDSIFVSDDLYALPKVNEDILILGISDPLDTLACLDSVKVYLEQYVSDPTKGFWYVVPIINGNPGAATPNQAGTLTDSLICFDISADITCWQELIGLDIELHPKKGTGAPPDWYADYLYVYMYITPIGVFDEGSDAESRDSELFVPTFALGEINFTYILNTSADISIEIYNIAGVRVFNKELNGRAGTNHITLKEIHHFSSGVYYLRTNTINQKGIQETKTAKFIVLSCFSDTWTH